MNAPHDLESRLRDLLHGAAGEVGPADLDLDRVRRRGRRRRTTSRSLMASFSVVALVCVGLVTARLVGDRGDEGFTMSSPTPEATVVPADERDDAGAIADADQDTVSDDERVTEPTVAEFSSMDELGAQVVAWGDGFARIAVVHDAPRLEPLTDEVIALFPDEVVEFFEGRFPETVDGGLAMLEERPDLLEEIQRVMAEHPEASAALAGTPTTGRVQVETSADGLVWESAGRLELPDDLIYISSVTALDGRLVVAGQTAPPGPDSLGGSGVSVASTSDFTNWDSVQTLEAAGASEPPAGLRRDVAINALDAAAGRVVISVIETLQIDIDALIPADVRAEIELTGRYSTQWDPSGIRIEVLGESEEATVVGPEGNEQIEYVDDEPIAVHEFTFSELGVDPNAVNGTQASVVWSGDPVAGLVRSAPVESEGWSSFVVSTGDGGFAMATEGQERPTLWYSSDGTEWIDRSPPIDPGSWSTGLFRTATGIVLVVDTGGELEHWRADSSAQGWAPVDVPVFRADEFGWVGMSSAGPSGTAVLYSYEPGPRPEFIDNQELVIERDGYRLTSRFSRTATPAELVRVGVDGGVDELVFAWDDLWGDPEHVTQLPDGGLVLLDPATGDELVTFTSVDFDRAYQDLQGEDGDAAMDSHIHPGQVLMWTVDGITWEELDRIEPGEPRSFNDTGDEADLWPNALVATTDRVLMGLAGPTGSVEYRTYDR